MIGGGDMFKVMLIIVNNYCNLHCEHCSAMSNLPLRSDSPWIHRRKKWEVSLDEIELFCKRLKGFSEGSFHRLLGGEPTALPIQKLYDIIDIFSSYNREVHLLTNGYNVMGIDKPHLDKIGLIEFDDHGINEKHIANCIKYLKNINYSGKIITRIQRTHYDLIYARQRESNRKIKREEGCPSIMSPPTFNERVIYPCCNGPNLEFYNNDTRMREELIAKGWSIDNPQLVDVLRKWKRNLPPYFEDQCLNHCWQPNVRSEKKARITKKPHDVISKPR